MENPASPTLAPFLGAAALVAWIIFSRVRRMVGRQKLVPLRQWTTIVLFSFLIALTLIVSFVRPQNALTLAGGVAIGAVLAIYGLRLTKFENTAAGLFYSPNAYLGIVLSLLFVGRLAYRALQLHAASDLATAQPADFMRSPLTLAIFGMLASYYVAYAVGLIRSSSRFRRT
jgi:hypothetical protein